MSSKCRPIPTAELWEILCAGHGWDPYPHGKNPDGSPAGLIENMKPLDRAILGGLRKDDDLDD